MTALAAGALWAQGQVDDPGGWTKAKWGMSRAQVSTAFPDATMQTDPISKKPVLAINGFPIQKVTFFVRFIFSQTDELQEVLLEPEGDRAVYPRAASSNLLSALTDKYGRPEETTPRHDRFSVRYEWKWLFPVTSMTLTFNDYGVANTSLAFLDYRRRLMNDAL